MRQIVKIWYNNRAYYSLYTAVSLSLILRKELSNDDGNGNKNDNKLIGLDWQNNFFNNFARASRFFVHFFTVVARLERENAYSRFVEDRRHKTISSLFSRILIQTFRIQLQKSLPTFHELNEME